MRRLVNSTAEGTNNFADIDKMYAYAVFIIEKEFNVGPITEDFLAMKFWNLLDEHNNKKYKNQNNPKGGKGKFVRGMG